MAESQTLWLAGVLCLLAGILLGALLARSGSRRDAARARQLEEELRTAQAEHDRYRAQVSEHFGETSRRLRDLTLQYKSVYEHLADGARALCPEGAVEIAPSLAEAALPAAAGVAAAEEDDTQLDLELDPPDRWAPVAHEDDHDDLGPLLDEDDESPAPGRAAS
jgi:uncharacterized membrane-anchored protein YhcB (DUF1043 family)